MNMHTHTHTHTHTHAQTQRGSERETIDKTHYKKKSHFTPGCNPGDPSPNTPPFPPSTHRVLTF